MGETWAENLRIIYSKIVTQILSLWLNRQKNMEVRNHWIR